MKKKLIRIGIVLVILVILAVLAVGLFLDSAIKSGIETFGPRMTKVSIKLDKVGISLLSGSGKISGLVVGNPEGFTTPQAIRIGSASLSLAPGSLLSDKVVIRTIEIVAPEITFEGGLGGNNLSKILANLDESTSGSNKAATAKPGTKLEVDDFIITGAKLHVSIAGLMGGSSVPVLLPDIHLTHLGAGPDGITAAALATQVLTEIEEAAAKAAGDVAASIGKDATEAIEGAPSAATGALNRIGENIGDLFKKK